MQFRLNPLAQLLSATMVLTLAACGGGGGDPDPAVTDSGVTPPATTPPAAASPAPVMANLSGNVFGDQAIRNAVVCLDLNANSACDTDEPASSRTGADGAYSLSYDTAKVTAAQAGGASLIAPMVPGAVTDASTTLDAANPAVGSTTTAYVLKQVPGKAGQINPLTTLVNVGVASGMTEAAARSNVAMQLAIPEAKIDSYQDDPVFDPAQIRDNARSMALVTALALQDGATLQVLDQNAQINAAPGDLASLRYTDNTSVTYRTLDSLDKASGLAGGRLRDSRGGLGQGSPLLHHFAYPTAYLSSSGWLRCDENVVIATTRGNPSRSTFCNSLEGVGYRMSSENISGQTMSTVVTAMQAESASNTINNGLPTGPLLASLGAATFPTGSFASLRRGFDLDQPIFISNLNNDGRPQATEGTLEQMIAARPTSGVNLLNAGTMLNLGLGSGNFKNLRVAFTGTTSPTAGPVQFYECDLNATQMVASNCAATQTGTYAISEVNGARLMRFAGHAETVMTVTYLFAEVRNAPNVAPGNWVYTTRQVKPTVAANSTTSKRLNATAWAAMKSQLGL